MVMILIIMMIYRIIKIMMKIMMLIGNTCPYCHFPWPVCDSLPPHQTFSCFSSWLVFVNWEYCHWQCSESPNSPDSPAGGGSVHQSRIFILIVPASPLLLLLYRRTTGKSQDFLKLITSSLFLRGYKSHHHFYFKIVKSKILFIKGFPCTVRCPL